MLGFDSIMMGATQARYSHLRITFGEIVTGGFLLSDFHALDNGVEYPVQSMTGNSTPSPLSVSANTDGANAWKVFSRGAGSWNPGAPSPTPQLTLDFGEIALPAPTHFSITVGVGSGSNPNEPITIEVSADGSTWTTLFSGSGIAWQPAGTPTVISV